MTITRQKGMCNEQKSSLRAILFLHTFLDTFHLTLLSSLHQANTPNIKFLRIYAENTNLCNVGVIQ